MPTGFFPSLLSDSLLCLAEAELVVEKLREWRSADRVERRMGLRDHSAGSRRSILEVIEWGELDGVSKAGPGTRGRRYDLGRSR